MGFAPRGRGPRRRADAAARRGRGRADLRAAGRRRRVTPSAARPPIRSSRRRSSRSCITRSGRRCTSFSSIASVDTRMSAPARFSIRSSVMRAQDTSSIVSRRRRVDPRQGRTTKQLREQVAATQADAIGRRHRRRCDERLAPAATLLLFGNGGSATDANDWAIDCVAAGPSQRRDPGAVARRSIPRASPRSPTTSAPRRSSCGS